MNHGKGKACERHNFELHQLRLCRAIVLLQCIFRPRLVHKVFQDFPSHRMFGHMHETLNVDEKTNYTVW
jgi:hypothetical protein